VVTARSYAQPAAMQSIYQESGLVFVLAQNDSPLMPCQPAVARVLLKQGKAKCVRRTPFVIKMISETTKYVQPITFGLDTASSTMGGAAVHENGDVLYLSQVGVRNDISKKMTARSKYRRNRRNRKTRYRKARWLHRGNSTKTGRFSPTMRSKFDTHLKEVAFVKSILPISRVILETGTFDPHALKNPEVLNDKSLYQKGVNYGFANSKAFVLFRDGYVCQHCKGKSKDKRLHVHHVIFRCNGGSDDESNLATVCKTCHDGVHKGTIIFKGTGKKKGQLSFATQMNSIRVQMLKLLPDAVETFGFITKEHRQLMDLPKEHYFDAVAIASQGDPVNFRTTSVFYKRSIASGDYQQTKGIRSEQRIPTGKIGGFRKFDKVQHNGSEYFIKGRMSTGYAILMDISGAKVDLKPIPKFDGMRRTQARTSWITSQKNIQNICC
jgi:hypothetical protein